MIEVVITESSNEIAESLIGQLHKSKDIQIAKVGSLLEADMVVNGMESAILVIGPSIPFDEALSMVDILMQSNTNIASILVTEKITADMLKKAIRAGFRDVVDIKNLELENAIFGASKFINPKSIKPDATSSDKKHFEDCRIITFLSTKGGVGKTFFAINTAVGLAKKNKKVLLLDFAYQSGDVGVMLGLKPEHTLDELLPVVDRLDEDMLRWFLVKHSSGVDVLLIPSNPESPGRLLPHQIQKIFEVARSMAEFLIVDTPSSFGESTLSILGSSDSVFLVTTLDVPSIKNTQTVMHTLKLLDYPENKINILLNRADSKVALLPVEVSKHLKHSIAVNFPSDRQVPISINEGIPLLLEKARRPVINSLNQIVTLSLAVQPNGHNNHGIVETEVPI